MSNIVDRSPVLVVDRSIFLSRAAMIELVRFHVKLGTVVHVEDGKRSRGDRFRYEVRTVEGGVKVVDAAGLQLGLLADVAALVALAEAVTQ